MKTRVTALIAGLVLGGSLLMVATGAVSAVSPPPGPAGRGVCATQATAARTGATVDTLKAFGDCEINRRFTTLTRPVGQDHGVQGPDLRPCGDAAERDQLDPVRPDQPQGHDRRRDRHRGAQGRHRQDRDRLSRLRAGRPAGQSRERRRRRHRRSVQIRHDQHQADRCHRRSQGQRQGHHRRPGLPRRDERRRDQGRRSGHPAACGAPAAHSGPVQRRHRRPDHRQCPNRPGPGPRPAEGRPWPPPRPAATLSRRSSSAQLPNAALALGREPRCLPAAGGRLDSPAGTRRRLVPGPQAASSTTGCSWKPNSAPGRHRGAVPRWCPRSIPPIVRHEQPDPRPGHAAVRRER